MSAGLARAEREAERAPETGEPLPGMLTRDQYLLLRDGLSFEHDLRIVVLSVCVNQALFALGLWLLQHGSWSGYLASQLVFPIVFFQAFSILHDCGHGSCFKRSWANSLVGHLASLWCCLPYFPWKYHHTAHHTWTGNVERDPTLKLVRAYQRTRQIPWLLRAAWRSWLPLGAAMQHVVFWTYPLDVLRSKARWQLTRCVFSVVWLGTAYVALHWLWPATFNFANFGLAIAMYLAAVELVNMPHHVGRPTVARKLALWEQGYATRSCYYPLFVSEFFVLNFNFHIEHHLFPTLPWYRLRTARAAVKDALQAGYAQAVGVEWNLRHRSQDIRNVLDGQGH